MDGQLAWKRLRRFQSRAELVCDTALARRVDLATLGTTMQILMRVGSPTGTVVQHHPPIEEIEAAAAKLRPVFLESEEIFHHNVLSALGFLTVSSAPETKTIVRECRETWKKITKSSHWAVEAGRLDGSGDKMPLTWDRQIAKDWLYGFLVHDDEDAQHRLRLLGDREKTMAALLWVKDGVLLVRATSQLIRDLEECGELAAA